MEMCGTDAQNAKWLISFQNSHSLLMLTSSIDVTEGEFYVELNFFKHSGRGATSRVKKHNPGRMSYGTLLKRRQCIIQIKNKDQLCCARAIVIIKARIDNDVQYDHLKRGRSLQEFLAKKLHQDAGVAEAPCGREELKQFQEYRGPEYQLIVLEGMKGKILFKDRLFDQAPKVIALLKTENHYHGVTSIPALLNRNFFVNTARRCTATRTVLTIIASDRTAPLPSWKQDMS